MGTTLTPAARSAAANACMLETALRRLAEAHGGDPELQASRPLPEVVAALGNPRLTAIEVLARACEAYADRPALGERASVLEDTAQGPEVRHLPAFRTLTYRTAWRRTAAPRCCTVGI